MPSSARKSSTGGARRLTQKAHIPYRGDNPDVGKKTGIAVGHVDRKSDGFEPFDELMQKADDMTPPRKRVKRKSAPAPPEDSFDEEDGEQSMQLDSPVQRLVNHRTALTPGSTRRRSSMRPIGRTSGVDFDEIPSPRPMSAKRGSRNAPVVSTTPVRSFRQPEREISDPSDRSGGDDWDYGGNDVDQSGYDDPPANDPLSDRVGETSFTQMDEEDEHVDEQQRTDDEDEEEEDPQSTPKASSRQRDTGKEKEVDKAPKKQRREPSEDEVEDEIEQGMAEVDLEPDSDVAEEEPPIKKPKISQEKEKKGTHETENRKKKENKPQRDGVRKSKRKPMKPLAYWRGERYVYGKPESTNGPIYVPNIKEIIRIPEEPHSKLGGKRKRGSTRPRSKSRAMSHGGEIPPAAPVENPEEGWDDETESQCVVLRYTTREEVERRIVWTAKMVKPRLAADQNWSFDKIFGDDDFIAAGQLIIPPKGRKPSKASKDNTYVFYVIEGAVNFKIHNQSMVVTSGGMFLVPRGNTYFIENICNRDARLFFTQARKVEMNEEEKAAKAAQAAEVQRRKSIARSSSAGAPSTAPRARNGRPASIAAPGR